MAFGSVARVILRAFGTWYKDLAALILFNLMWVALLFPIVTAAPATAALYVIVARVADGEYVGPREYLREIRRQFVRAWVWFIPQLIVYGIGFFNLRYYASQTSDFWLALRWVWAIVLLFWTAIQLFYWPLLVEQEDQSFGNTFRNAFVMISANPLFAFLILVMCAALIFVSALTTLPVGIALAVWIALIGTYAVRDRLGIYRERSKPPPNSTDISS